MQQADTAAGSIVGLDFDFRTALDQGIERIEGWVMALIGGLPTIIAAILIIGAFWLVARAARRVVRAALGRVSDHNDLNRMLGTLTFTSVLLVGVFLALGVLELDKTVTTLLAGAGIIGLALGFAFRDIAENFISGIVMMLRRPFRDGDIIETSDHLGIVEHINMRATEIRTFQDQLVIVPNSQVFKSPIVVHTQSGLRRVELDVGVSYGDDLAKARRVAIEAVESIDEREQDRDVELFYEGFGDSSINFQIRFWIRFDRWTDFLRARSDAVMRIKDAFDANDITIPFPIRTLDFSTVGGRTLREAWPASA